MRHSASMSYIHVYGDMLARLCRIKLRLLMQLFDCMFCAVHSACLAFRIHIIAAYRNEVALVIMCLLKVVNMIMWHTNSHDLIIIQPSQHHIIGSLHIGTYTSNYLRQSWYLTCIFIVKSLDVSDGCNLLQLQPSANHLQVCIWCTKWA